MKRKMYLFKEDNNNNNDDGPDLSALGSPDGVVPSGGGGTDDPGNADDDGFKPDPGWNTLKRMIPEDQREKFEIPEDVNSENETEKLKEAFNQYLSDGTTNKKAETPKGMHPLAHDLQREFLEKGEDFDIKAWQNKISSVADYETIKSKPYDQFIKDDLVNQYGWKSEDNPDGIEEADIDDYIKSMNKIQLKKEGSRLKNEALKEAEKFNPQNFSVEPPKPEEIKADVEKNINSVFEEAKKNKAEIKLGGVDISEALQDSKEDLINAFLPDENGVRPIDQLLQSNENFMKFYYLMSKGDDFFKSMLSEKAQRMKIREYIEKLDENPDNKGSFGKNNPNEIDPSSLGQPES